MKNAIAPVKNLQRLAELGDLLENRAARTPGIGIVTGDTGVGKSTGLTWYVGKKKAPYVRAMQLWTPSSMLTAIAQELDVAPHRDLARMTTEIVNALATHKSPLIIDEADYVVDQKRLLNPLRDIHDLSQVPLILIGMAEFSKKLSSRIDQRQFSGRVAFKIEFAPLDLEDTNLLATTLLEGVKMEPDLVQRLHEVCEGSTRLICVGLQLVETHARTKNLKSVGLKEWGDRPLTPMAIAARGARAHAST
jgi:DNA transposition AAA+ family ATPase